MRPDHAAPPGAFAVLEEHLRLPARLEHLARAKAFLAEAMAKAGLDARQSGRLELALEEVFVNICHYAYPEGASGDIELRARATGERFEIDLLDEGLGFDPGELAPPDLASVLGQRIAGGLGWFLTRQMVQELHCRREGGRNLVSLVVVRDGKPAFAPVG